MAHAFSKGFDQVFKSCCDSSLENVLGDPPGLLSDAVIKHRPKASWWRKEITYLAYGLQSILWGSQDRKVEAGTDAEALDKCCLLACSSRLAQPVFFFLYSVKTWLLLDSGNICLGMISTTTHYSELGPPSQSLIKKMPPEEAGG